MLSIFTTHTHTQKQCKESFGGDKYVYSLDPGDGSRSVYIYPNVPNCIH